MWVLLNWGASVELFCAGYGVEPLHVHVVVSSVIVWKLVMWVLLYGFSFELLFNGSLLGCRVGEVSCFQSQCRFKLLMVVDPTRQCVCEFELFNSSVVDFLWLFDGYLWQFVMFRWLLMSLYHKCRCCVFSRYGFGGTSLSLFVCSLFAFALEHVEVVLVCMHARCDCRCSFSCGIILGWRHMSSYSVFDGFGPGMLRVLHSMLTFDQTCVVFLHALRLWTTNSVPNHTIHCVLDVFCLTVVIDTHARICMRSYVIMCVCVCLCFCYLYLCPTSSSMITAPRIKFFRDSHHTVSSSGMHLSTFLEYLITSGTCWFWTVHLPSN